VYGEPWRADNTSARRGTLLCDKGSLKKIDPKIGAFCDDTRDAVKGNVMDAGSVGFVNGGSIRSDILHRCVAGWAGELGAYGTPNQTITYLSCHDDWTLWDKLIYTMDPDKNFLGTAANIQKANRLAAAINFCCQGRPFFLSGEEFGRTKGGIKNSYCSSAEINRLDWQRAWQNQGMVDYYRGLIALRQQCPGLQDKTEKAHQRILWSKDLEHNAAAVCLDNQGGGSKWETLLMIFCCGDKPQPMVLPEGKWQVLVDGDSAFQWRMHIGVRDSCTVPPGTALILGKLPE
jgi:pullulanase